MQRIGFYPGSFDPLTNGHLDIIGRASALVDCLVIAVGAHHGKAPMLAIEERIRLLELEAAPLVHGAGAKAVITTFDGLAVDAAREAGAMMVIRGLRNGTDFDYEMQMAGMNATMAPKLETVFLTASPSTAFIASSLVKQIANMGGDITAFVPASVATAIADRIGA
jgi:pantetheine-phosphate adenylyltransferase